MSIELALRNQLAILTALENVSLRLEPQDDTATHAVRRQIAETDKASKSMASPKFDMRPREGHKDICTRDRCHCGPQ
ncbi:hypothetical protein ACT4MK_26370 [Bradyrhizobium barranii]|uniref:Uncharacterized protein n=1 Tax=Bradyrhizobium barranii subsp. barranii TaxID=2823807 RepID=A0A7Z0Q670_9BRAD|nr:hypothetical protein [Bradyrhizobium barranii]UGX96433.1 hypothetical protein G6321_00015330 [Bradyrhizobium barranii subsp. barranii]